MIDPHRTVSQTRVILRSQARGSVIDGRVVVVGGLI
jgi:hypothetical protein